MIVVNSSGSDSVYPLLDHAPWHGCTFADFVFPSFLVIMGVSLSLSLRSRLSRGERRARIFKQALQRAAIIFVLGLLMNLVYYASGSQPNFRYMGVLQRIALCYLGASTLFLAAGWKRQAATAAALLAGYWLLLTRAPVPGFGPPDLTEQGNLVSWLDRLLLHGHIYKPYFDPEGVLGTLPSLATTLLGVLAGRWLGTSASAARKAGGMIAAGAALAAAGWAWSYSFPFNKHLWTSSFALWTGGGSLAAFGATYGAIEARGAWPWLHPLEWFGRNSLLSYFLSGLGYGAQEFVSIHGVEGRVNVKLWLTTSLFGSWLAPQAASLAYALCYTALCLLVMSEFHRREMYLKI